jgi:hypothetical protein
MSFAAYGFLGKQLTNVSLTVILELFFIFVYYSSISCRRTFIERRRYE